VKHMIHFYFFSSAEIYLYCNNIDLLFRFWLSRIYPAQCCNTVFCVELHITSKIPSSQYKIVVIFCESI
jgi:hypothetical protein